MNHSVIRFLWPKGLSANAIHFKINPLYGVTLGMFNVGGLNKYEKQQQQ